MPDITPLSQLPPASQSDPVAMISAILDAEKVMPDSKAQPAKADAPVDTGNPGDAEQEYVPQNNAETEGADVDAKPAVAEIPLDQLEAIELEITVKDEGGKDVTRKASIKDLREGYMRQQDYSRKTQDIARQREEVIANIRQAVETERTQYLQQLNLLQEALVASVAPEVKNADWNALATNDPFKYVELRNRAEQIQAQLTGIKAKQQEVIAKMEADRRQAAIEAAPKTWAKLEADIPGWNADAYKASLKAAEAFGYTEQEVGAWLDPRAIKLLHKAHLYDQLKAGPAPADKKVVAAPKVIKPGATQAASRTQVARSSAMERLRKSGKTDDLAAVLETMI